MNLEYFENSDHYLITYNSISLTYKDFFVSVNNLIVKFDNFKEVDDFVIIKEDNPLKFYPLLFALWKMNKKVVFPNRDFFDGNNFEFVKFIITYDNIVSNNDYTKLSVDNNIDTILFSSGSTGKPKGICHTNKTFIKNASFVKKELNINSITSITPLKPYLVSALSHFLVHLMSHSHIIFIDIEKIKEVEQISKNIDNLAYLGSPMHIISMLPFIKNKSPYMFFSSGDIFYPAVIKDIFSLYPDTKFFNVYGMAELGGRIFINYLDKFSDTVEFNSIGKSIDPIDVTINKENEVILQSDLLFQGYIIDGIFINSNNVFKTGDEVTKVKQHYEFFGRKNDEIKIAGNKVSMKYIEQKISISLSKNYTPIVISQKHELLGNILILILYSVDNLTISREELILKLRENLENYELPHKFYYTTSISYTQTMKIDRKKLIKKLDCMELLK